MATSAQTDTKRRAIAEFDRLRTLEVKFPKKPNFDAQIEPITATSILFPVNPIAFGRTPARDRRRPRAGTQRPRLVSPVHAQPPFDAVNSPIFNTKNGRGTCSMSREIGMPKLSRLVLKSVAAAVLLSMSLLATTLEQLSLDDMIQKSTGVVRARVTGSYTALVGVDIYTYYRLDVSETWKGQPATQLDVAVPGGSLRGQRQVVAGAPPLVAGEEYVLFLWTSRSGLTQVIGLSQGSFSVKADASNTLLLVRPAAADNMLDKNGRVVADQPLNLRLTDVRSKVRLAGGLK